MLKNDGKISTQSSQDIVLRRSAVLSDCLDQLPSLTEQHLYMQPIKQIFSLQLELSISLFQKQEISNTSYE